MHTDLGNIINSIYPVSGDCILSLQQELELVKLQRRHLVLREGERCDHAFFVIKGLLRSYYTKGDAEICCRFMHENHIGLSTNSFYMRRVGYENIETIEPTIIARIHYNKLQKLYTKFPEFNFVARVWTEHYSSMTDNWLYMMRKQSAEERYRFFVKKYPELIQRVPLKYIASFLGVNLETLSRIRSKLASSNKTV